MRANMTYTNEFTGEIFSEREDCVKAERESKKDFIKKSYCRRGTDKRHLQRARLLRQLSF